MEFADFIRTAQVEGVTLYQANQLPIKGTLCVTGHHLILSSRDNHIEELWVNLNYYHSRVTNVYKNANKKYGCTVDQELADTAVYAPGICCVYNHQMAALFCMK